ncbi:OadG family protein [Acetoanaerobium noterae]|jgi:sodium pump decarboxylase gamma subunit|uniref:OadG family protein n=1 Tax=Acetoanaerobium noterae TaxID=745369 RepID=UPI001B73D04B|nr:OadG family protein [Acetoanaerobium sp.]MBP9562393.1 OadG family protein [Acetoanaerobium sp.]MDK2804168.1 glutaconyl-CoA/methylmalonyl-CoA decarboxylase subunit delta [Peptostreptococcaceae bacterium]
MNINEILDQMSHDITALTFGEKMLGGLAVTALSMAIVFLVLVLLIGIIKAMDSMVNPKSKQENEESNEFDNIQSYEQEQEPSEDISELIAVISAAVACSMGVSESKIRVVNINRVGNDSPTWAKNGRLEQLQNRL